MASAEDKRVQVIALVVELAVQHPTPPVHLEISLKNEEGQAIGRIIARMREALYRRHAMLDCGAHVESNTDVLRWLFQEIGRQADQKGVSGD
jgi:hypothetical protein